MDKLIQKYQLYWNALEVQFKKHGRRGLIDTVINIYRDNYPINYKKFCDACKKKQKALKNPFADAGDPNFVIRELYKLPDPIRNTCQRVLRNIPGEPIFEETKEEQKWIWENYPQFRIATKL